MWWYALWDVCIWCSSVFMCKAEVYEYETLDPTIFGVIDQLYLNYFPVAMMGLKCRFILDDVMLWHVLTWPFWKSSISIVLGYFLVACCEPKYIVIYLRCIWVAHWDPMHIVICSSVARWESMDFDIYQWYPQLLIRTDVNVIWCFYLLMEVLMFLLWIFFWYFFPVACIGLRWFYNSMSLG